MVDLGSSSASAREKHVVKGAWECFLGRKRAVEPCLGVRWSLGTRISGPRTPFAGENCAPNLRPAGRCPPCPTWKVAVLPLIELT